ncbi:MAG: ATP-binding protein, partial [Verrucomicrobiota bacterium]
MTEPLTYPLPANEAERLAVLRECAILDTDPEAEFDDLLTIAAKICDTPVASITLIDETRQWFKASIGMGITETPRRISFCAHTICQPNGEILQVPDATRDTRFANYDNVTGPPGIRFYAGAPLITHDGFALGSLCLVDRRPRQLDDNQLRTLRILSRHVVNALELRRLLHAQERTIARLEQTRCELEAARAVAEQSSAAKSRFLAATSHEIRTPLNAIIGMSTLLTDANLTAAQRDCTETIRSAGEILLALVNDILDLSKIESGRLELDLRPFHLATGINRALDCLRGAARTKGLKLETRLAPGLPDHVVGDPTRIQQILVNLVANAIKFTTTGSVTLDVSLVDNQLHLAVTDTGIGIPADRIDRLFQDYNQADRSTTRTHGGTGLGLSISKRLAELHGGRIWVESIEGRGSTFHVAVADTRPDPSAIGASPEAAQPHADFAAAHPFNILVADDNPVNQKVAGMLLKRLGYQPAFADDGQAALEAALSGRHDLVLMDSEMPRLDGIAATARIRREIPLGRQPLIVAVTPHAANEDRQRLRDAVMDDSLPKPGR